MRIEEVGVNEKVWIFLKVEKENEEMEEKESVAAEDISWEEESCRKKRKEMV